MVVFFIDESQVRGDYKESNELKPRVLTDDLSNLKEWWFVGQEHQQRQQIAVKVYPISQISL
jgi:hypothetical protein